LFTMFLIYSPDGISGYGSRGGEFERIRVGVWVDSCTIGTLPIHFFGHFCFRMYRLATMHSVTD